MHLLYIHRHQENWVTPPNGQSYHLKYQLLLKTKEDVRGARESGFQAKFSKWRSHCLADARPDLPHWWDLVQIQSFSSSWWERHVETSCVRAKCSSNRELFLHGLQSSSIVCHFENIISLKQAFCQGGIFWGDPSCSLFTSLNRQVALKNASSLTTCVELPHDFLLTCVIKHEEKYGSRSPSHWACVSRWKSLVLPPV